VPSVAISRHTPVPLLTQSLTHPLTVQSRCTARLTVRSKDSGNHGRGRKRRSSACQLVATVRPLAILAGQLCIGLALQFGHPAMGTQARPGVMRPHEAQHRFIGAHISVLLAQPIVQGLDVDRPPGLVAQGDGMMQTHPVFDGGCQGIGSAGLVLPTVGLTLLTHMIAHGSLGDAEDLANRGIGLPRALGGLKSHDFLRSELGAIGCALPGRRRCLTRAQDREPTVYLNHPAGTRNTSCPLGILLACPLTRSVAAAIAGREPRALTRCHSSAGRVRESAPVDMREPRQLAGKSAPPISLGRRFPALRLKGGADWNRHQPDRKCRFRTPFRG
jgi:hypothetical protein